MFTNTKIKIREVVLPLPAPRGRRHRMDRLARFAQLLWLSERAYRRAAATGLAAHFERSASLAAAANGCWLEILASDEREAR